MDKRVPISGRVRKSLYGQIALTDTEHQTEEVTGFGINYLFLFTYQPGWPGIHHIYKPRWPGAQRDLLASVSQGQVLKTTAAPPQLALGDAL